MALTTRLRRRVVVCVDGTWYNEDGQEGMPSHLSDQNTKRRASDWAITHNKLQAMALEIRATFSEYVPQSRKAKWAQMRRTSFSRYVSLRVTHHRKPDTPKDSQVLPWHRSQEAFAEKVARRHVGHRMPGHHRGCLQVLQRAGPRSRRPSLVVWLQPRCVHCPSRRSTPLRWCLS